MPAIPAPARRAAPRKFNRGFANAPRHPRLGRPIKCPEASARREARPLTLTRRAVLLYSGWQPIPGYRLTRPLGAGSFAEVWEAERDDGEKVALKFLDCRTRSVSMVASEVRMLRSLTALNHPYIVPLHGAHA